VLGLISRARGLGVALVALALTAGAVLAGGGPPSDPGYGRQTAEQASGQIVPVIAEEEGDEEAAPVAEEETEEPETDEEVEEALVETDTEGWDNHGALVSEAAQMETPDAFEGDHGAFVSCVARMNRGQLGPDADLSELVLAELTPDDCDGEDGDTVEGETEAEADTAGTDDGPGRSGEAKARKEARGQRGNGHGNGR